MLVCSYARMLVCSYARMLVCSYARMLVCSYARMLVCSYARMLVCSYARMLVCSYARMLVCSYARMLVCNSLPLPPEESKVHPVKKHQQDSTMHAYDSSSLNFYENIRLQKNLCYNQLSCYSNYSRSLIGDCPANNLKHLNSDTHRSSLQP
ncbi:hypothetical protein PAEAM_15220 [Paenibacillus sp. GM1FR]|nr:hypothetical protein PAEAM_15220 [Paenibacillus sp. GM1FR]